MVSHFVALPRPLIFAYLNYDIVPPSLFPEALLLSSFVSRLVELTYVFFAGVYLGANYVIWCHSIVLSMIIEAAHNSFHG